MELRHKMQQCSINRQSIRFTCALRHSPGFMELAASDKWRRQPIHTVCLSSIANDMWIITSGIKAQETKSAIYQSMRFTLRFNKRQVGRGTCSKGTTVAIHRLANRYRDENSRCQEEECYSFLLELLLILLILLSIVILHTPPTNSLQIPRTPRTKLG